VVADSVPISTPNRKINKDAQAEMASAQTMVGFKERATKGGTPKRLWPSTDNSVERQDEVHAAQTPVRIKANRTGSRAPNHNTRFQVTLDTENDASRTAKKPSGIKRECMNQERAGRDANAYAGMPLATTTANIGPGSIAALLAIALRMARHTGTIVGSTMMIKELLLPHLHNYIPAIITFVKRTLANMRASAVQIAARGMMLARSHPAATTAYALIMLATSAAASANETRRIAAMLAHAQDTLLAMYGFTRVKDIDNLNDDANGSDSPPSSQVASDEEELGTKEHDAGTTEDTDGDEDENASYKDFTSFWETRPTREMNKQLSSHEIDAHKTDLNVATLETWKLKVLTFMRRRHPQFGALLQLTWTDDDHAAALEIATDTEHGAAANMWGASALLALIDVTKPKAKVFEHELLELERQVPGTTSSGIEIAARLASLLTARHTGDEEADFKKLETTQYLKLGMDKDAIKLAIAQLQSQLR